MEEYLAEVEAGWDRVMGRPVRELKGLRAEEILFSEPKRPARVRPTRLRNRQVSVKLTAEEFSSLKEAAGRYSVPSSTLARILVVRGVQAALDRD